MRILAASFQDAEEANAARARLGRDFDLSEDGLLIAPLGTTGRPDAPTAILAGRFENDLVDAVRASVRKSGGTVVVDTDEGLDNG